MLTKFGLLKEDLDYHLVRASMVIIFFFFGYQIVALSLEKQRDEVAATIVSTLWAPMIFGYYKGRRRSQHDLCGISVPKAAAAGPRQRDGVRGGGRGRP